MKIDSTFFDNFIKWDWLFARYKLTTRQRQSCRLAAMGYRDDQIGRQLGIHPGTVKVHLRAVYIKLRVKSRHHILLMMIDQSYQHLKDRPGQGV